MQRVHVEHDFSKPVDRIFAYLSEHENLGAIFPARVKHVRDGDASRNGVGSVRRLSIGPLPPFEETVTACEPGERIEYRITKGSPLRGHRGTMVFSPRPDGGSHLAYTIEFGAIVPGLAKLVALGLDRSIRRGLPKVDANA